MISTKHLFKFLMGCNVAIVLVGTKEFLIDISINYWNRKN